VYFWMERGQLQLRRRTLLLGISIGLVPLGARLIFSLGGAFGSTTSPFSLVSGSVLLYGLLAVLPEFLVVFNYTIVGLILPLDQDLKEGGLEGRQEQGNWRPKLLERLTGSGYDGTPTSSYNSAGYYANGNRAGDHRYPPQSR